MTTSIGPELGTYHIISRLSVGGMGEVYLAEDTRLHRKVALKVLPPEWGSDPERLERFQWETRVLATLNHPNIVTIYSVEEAGDVHFFTMELVEGQTLREIIPVRGLALDRFLDLAVPLADALSAAHQRGIIHRDVKPGNIMVRPDGRLKMLDFGLAKREPGSAPIQAEAAGLRGQEPQTQDGRLLGTVAYMSPEQMAGRTLDHRADIFTLGIVYYEMLTGVRPFEDSDWAEKIAVHLHEKGPLPAPPEAQLPERLEQIVHRCLERDPDKRYQTAEELREDLTGLQLEIVSGSFSSTQITRPDFGRPRRWWIAAVAGALLILAVAMAYVLLPRWFDGVGFGGVGFGGDGFGKDSGSGEPVTKKRIAVLPFQNKGGEPGDEYFAAGITEEIISRLATVSALKVIRSPPGEASSEPGGVEGPRQIGQDLGVDYLLEGSVFWSRDSEGRKVVRVIALLTQVSDGTHLWSEIFDKVIDDILEVQSEIAEEVLRQLNVRLAEPDREKLASVHTSNPEAYQAYLRGLAENVEAWEAYQRGMEYASRHEPNPKNWRLALDMLERAVRLDPEFAPAHAELSRVHSFFYHQSIDRTEERLASAREAAERALAIAPQLADGHRALGYYYYWGRGDYEKALDEFYTALEQLPNDSQLYEGIAYIRRRQGRFDDALEAFRRAIELNPKSNWLAAEMAHTHSNLRNFAEAERLYDRAIRLAPDQPLPYQMKALNTLRWRGDVAGARAILAEMPGKNETGSLYNRAKVEVIARDYPKAISILRGIESDLVGLDSALFPKEMSLGAVHLFLGATELAKSHYEAARRILEAKVEERPDDPRLRSALGLTYAGLTRLGFDLEQQAIEEGLKAVALYPVERDAFVGPDFLELLAMIYAGVGELDRAVDVIEDVLGRPASLSKAYLRIRPSWDTLRGYPRFERLIAED